MSLSVSSTCFSDASGLLDRFNGDAIYSAVQKVKGLLTSFDAQLIIGFGLGLGIHKIYSPLTQTVISLLGFSPVLADPFGTLSLGWKVIMTPFVCFLIPLLEEQQFRGDLQEALADKLEPFYANQGCANPAANGAARITSLFFTAVIFGLAHFTNALFFWCNPTLFLPQVVAATIMGLLFGAAKELTGTLHLPIGMHMGNNTLAWSRL